MGAVAALVLLCATPARGRVESSPFEVSLARDLTILAAGATLWAGIGGVASELPASVTCNPCDRAGVNAMDRPVVNYHSAGARRASDLLVAALPTLAVGGFFFDLGRWGWRGVAEDVLLAAQAMALTGAVQQLTALAVRRPRPFMYRGDTDERRDNADANMSFFSGHTASAFAAAVSFATIFTLRRPHSRFRAVVWVASLLLASAVPLCRVAAGKHFWSDVLAGAAVGTSVGILVPLLHRRPRWSEGVQLSASATGIGLVGQF
ncbi:MAG: phosphatase PAP2 family protein [Deltaproteobacteria bacterium]|nr:phosphatase PAP2 family protein [Deltaproteobacteria bacterium]